ncbi:MAG: peptidase T [Clostridiales bacterium]|nr:peptidase T [Clostridiales bacterium]
MNLKDELKKVFLDLVRFDTASDPKSETYPSCENLSDFAEYLSLKLAELDLKDIKIDNYSYLTATLPSNTDKKCKTIGFLAHTDTSPDYSGNMIKPQIWENYDGSDINLKDGVNITAAEFPFLKNYIGKTLITADGTTLLGADDKAGIAEILCAVKYLNAHPEIKHGKIRIAFTPDEEIGKGTDFFDIEAFGCDFAYTADGGGLGELSYENFNAASAEIVVKGKNVHPGSAKDIMKNALLVANEFVSLLPDETPSNTENREGFYHLTDLRGTVSKAELSFIIRDFDKDNFEKRKETMKKITDKLNEKYGEGTVDLTLEDSYYNMLEIIEKHPYTVELAKKAMVLAGVTPEVIPTRGGTDGSRLSFEGLPCPNLFTGGHNYHGPYELICLESMEKACETIINIIKLEGEENDGKL